MHRATSRFWECLEKLPGDVQTLEHPNQTKYPGQKISVVIVEGYAFLVPYVETEEEVFLKTIIPSRKATKKYVGRSK